MLNIENLRVDLDTDDAVIRAVDAMWLSIERGETFALVGESGCGKSMTALALMRLLPENGRVTNGRLLVGDEDILACPRRRCAACAAAASA
jgi:peptide/nickel transport system ATP-binding protein